MIAGMLGFRQREYLVEQIGKEICQVWTEGPIHKKVGGLIQCFFMPFALPLPAYAANQVDTLDIQAVIYQDGSMGITQNWSGQ